MQCQDSFQTSGDASRVDCCAGNVLDCRTARNMFYTVRIMSYYVRSGAVPYSHVDTPVPVRSLKLSNVGSG